MTSDDDSTTEVQTEREPETADQSTQEQDRPADPFLPPVGNRTRRHMAQFNGPRCRSPGPYDYTAVLVRGLSYTLSYEFPLVFDKGRPVRVNKTKFRYLCDVIDPVDFHDGHTRVRRRIRKFRFRGPDGAPIELPSIPDEYIDGVPVSDPFAVAQLERDLEGDDET